MIKRLVFLVLFASAAAWSCLPPSNIQGVALNSGEEFDLSVFSTLGEEGVSYIRDSTASGIMIRYISRYSPFATVYIGTSGVSFQEDITINCMGVLYEIADRESSGPVSRDEFDFAQAILVELQWLVQAGVLSLTEEAIGQIYDSLYSAENGGVQYWTLQEQVLGFNSWFTDDGQEGVWGVNGTESVRNGCSIIEVEMADLSAELGSASVGASRQSIRSASLKAVQVDRNTFAIHLPHFVQPGSRLALFNPSGRMVAFWEVGGGAKVERVKFPDSASSGVYYFVLTGGKDEYGVKAAVKYLAN